MQRKSRIAARQGRLAEVNSQLLCIGIARQAEGSRASQIGDPVVLGALLESL